MFCISHSSAGGRTKPFPSSMPLSSKRRFSHSIKLVLRSLLYPITSCNCNYMLVQRGGRLAGYLESLKKTYCLKKKKHWKENWALYCLWFWNHQRIRWGQSLPSEKLKRQNSYPDPEKSWAEEEGINVGTVPDTGRKSVTFLSRAIPPNREDKVVWGRAALGKRKEGTEPTDDVLDSTVRLERGVG